MVLPSREGEGSGSGGLGVAAVESGGAWVVLQWVPRAQKLQKWREQTDLSIWGKKRSRRKIFRRRWWPEGGGGGRTEDGRRVC